MPKTKTPPAKQAILEVLKVQPQASVAQIAVSAGVGRSTASKLLAQLESDREVSRIEGGREGKRRLPDLWSLAGQQPEHAQPGDLAVGVPGETVRLGPVQVARGELGPGEPAHAVPDRSLILAEPEMHDWSSQRRRRRRSSRVAGRR